MQRPDALGDRPQAIPVESPPPPGDVRGSGGRVVLDMGQASARLVSATPAAGWQVRVWEAAGWIRVDFTRGDGTTSSCFVTWNGHPPMVRTT
ncbi:hypothetical protein [Amycolatopsis anabasis]|uniref:hypothetical protein n=1 Tax=Amycolatopsis anabasis TaxID=1840409 RepID=UPI00131DF3F1|nr:hypothetical protein [Amycolatopsis anabasis]